MVKRIGDLFFKFDQARSTPDVFGFWHVIMHDDYHGDGASCAEAVLRNDGEFLLEVTDKGTTFTGGDLEAISDFASWVREEQHSIDLSELFG